MNKNFYHKLRSIKFPEISNTHENKNFFHWELEFPAIFSGNKSGFDCVIGNPPYISFGLRNVGKIDNKEKTFYEKKYSSAQYKISLYSLFIEKASDVCKKNGKYSLIVPDSFLLGKYYEETRAVINSAESSLKSITLFHHDFWTAGSIGRPTIFVAIRDGNRKGLIVIIYAKNLEGIKKGNEKRTIVRKHKINPEVYKTTPLKRFYIFVDKIQEQVLRKITSNMCELKDCVKFYSGLIGKKGKSSILFSFDDSKIKDLEVSPLLESGKFLRPYFYELKNKVIIHDPSLYHSGYKREYYENPKVFLNQTGDTLKSCVDENGVFCLNNIHIGYPLKSKEILYVISAILNSDFGNSIYKFISMEVGRAMAQVDIDVMDKFPLPSEIISFKEPIENIEINQVDQLPNLDRLYILSKTLHKVMSLRVNYIDKENIISVEQCKELIENNVLEAYKIEPSKAKEFIKETLLPFGEKE